MEQTPRCKRGGVGIQIEYNGNELSEEKIKKLFDFECHIIMKPKNPAHNKNYMSIAVLVLTTSRIARNSGGAPLTHESSRVCKR